jgi:hypothetical protein
LPCDTTAGRDAQVTEDIAREGNGSDITPTFGAHNASLARSLVHPHLTERGKNRMLRSFEFVTREALCNCHSSPLLPQAALFRCTEQWRLPSTHDLSIKTRPSLLSRGSAATYLRFACVRTDDYFVSVHVTLSFEEDATIRSVAFVHRSRVC